jgi:hypothetical protein
MRLKFLLVATLLVTSASASAGLVRVELKEQRPWLAGKEFAAGQYELLSGTAFYEVDPSAKSSRDITDVQIAPRNAHGKVEFSGPFLILRPLDPSRANGATIFEVANRGTTQMDGVLAEFDSLSLTANETRDVSRPALFDLGYTFAWAAWQGDLKPDEFALKVPTADVSGLVRSAAFLGMEGESTDASPVSAGWCAADAADPDAVLRVHSSFDDPGRQIARSGWRFARREADGTVVSDPCAYVLATPLTAPALVTVVYRSSGSKMLGLGQAAVRDFASHLRHRDVPSALNARPGDARHLIAFGYSQSGRFLRDFLYRGFNADERARPVFDGILDTASGAGRGSFNHRFATPGQAGNSVGSALRAVDLYPFADLRTPDIDGKGRDGLLDRARSAGVQPRIMHILTSSEYWARVGSLLHTTTDGKRSLPEAEGTRTYAFAGVPHGPRRATTFLIKDTSADYPYNDNEDLFLAMPALVEAMRCWLAESREPPASRHPMLGSSLVSPDRLKFPALTGVKLPAGPPPVWQLDLGPDYRTKGIIAEPPKIGRRYPLLVPQVDEDGNELGSWRGLATSVPLGTYTAWNHQTSELDSFGYLAGLQGAYFPFAATEAARKRQDDPRRSINERYGGLHGYMAAVERAIAQQVDAGFLLPQERDHARTWMRLVWDRTEGLQRHWPPPE